MGMIFKSCDPMKYRRLRDARWTKVDGGFSQENVRLRVFGNLIAYSQPDMLSDTINPPDMCWCMSFQKRTKK